MVLGGKHLGGGFRGTDSILQPLAVRRRGLEFRITLPHLRSDLFQPTL